MIADFKSRFKHLETRIVNGTEVWFDFADKAADDPVFGRFKNCGMMTVPEAEILHAVARQLHGHALDIGGFTGFTAMVLGGAAWDVTSVDPMYKNDDFAFRFMENKVNFFNLRQFPGSSVEFFSHLREGRKFSVVSIDGDHEGIMPTHDAVHSYMALEERGAIVFHDTHGEDVQNGVNALRRYMNVKEYDTAFGLAVCWRGDLVLP